MAKVEEFVPGNVFLLKYYDNSIVSVDKVINNSVYVKTLKGKYRAISDTNGNCFDKHSINGKEAILLGNIKNNIWKIMYG